MGKLFPFRKKPYNITVNIKKLFLEHTPMRHSQGQIGNVPAVDTQ